MKLWLAPLHGITYYNFRNCFVKHFQNIDCAITPFIAAKPKEELNLKKLSDLFPENNRALPIIPQIMGNKPNDIKETALALHETFGYEQFNWNIGCPMNPIVRKKRGCGVMPFPDLVEETVNAVCRNSSVRFSLKMRLGLHSPNEGLEVLQRVAPYPLDFLCIHPRLGTQQYTGAVDLDTFEIFYQSTNHQIVYSGDINNVDFFMHLQQRFPKIENWMLGRGILKNPFLAEEIMSLSKNKDFRTLITLIGHDQPDKRILKIRENLLNQCHQSSETSLQQRFMDFHHEYSEIILSLFGEKIALSVFKELWHYFAVFWKLSPEALQELLRINDYTTLLENHLIISSSFLFLPRNKCFL